MVKVKVFIGSTHNTLASVSLIHRSSYTDRDISAMGPICSCSFFYILTGAEFEDKLKNISLTVKDNPILHKIKEASR